MDTRIWRLRGQSRIVDSDGTALGQLAESEGILTADVVMDPARTPEAHRRTGTTPDSTWRCGHGQD
jgi:predicted amidohydrolase